MAGNLRTDNGKPDGTISGRNFHGAGSGDFPHPVRRESVAGQRRILWRCSGERLLLHVRRRIGDQLLLPFHEPPYFLFSHYCALEPTEGQIGSAEREDGTPIIEK